MTHTPLPWVAVTPCPGECCWHIVEAATVTAETTWEDWVNVPEMSEADAKLIVRCVNAHHTLVAALRKIAAMDPQRQRADDLGRAARIAREALTDDAQPSCEWHESDPEGPEPQTYDSACGEKWSFTEGGAKENGIKFCHHCGKPVEIVAFRVAADEADGDGVASTSKASSETRNEGGA
jgi:hypothetical protein